MKTLHNNLVSVGTLAASAMLFILCFLFTECKKENRAEQDPITPTTFARPDSVADLIAYYNPEKRVLLVDNDYRTQVLLELGAQPAIDGSFQAASVNLTGEPVTIRFTIIPLPTEMKATIAAEAAKPLTPDLIHHYTVDGTDFRQYKNAKCGREDKGFDGPCTDLSNGTSTMNKWYTRFVCERGLEFCTEVRGVIGRKVVHLNTGCQGPIVKEESYYGWQCK